MEHHFGHTDSMDASPCIILREAGLRIGKLVPGSTPCLVTSEHLCQMLVTLLVAGAWPLTEEEQHVLSLIKLGYLSFWSLFRGMSVVMSRQSDVMK